MAEEVKKKRGRPKGSKNKKKTEDKINIIVEGIDIKKLTKDDVILVKVEPPISKDLYLWLDKLKAEGYFGKAKVLMVPKSFDTSIRSVEDFPDWMLQ